MFAITKAGVRATLLVLITLIGQLRAQEGFRVDLESPTGDRGSVQIMKPRSLTEAAMMIEREIKEGRSYKQIVFINGLDQPMLTEETLRQNPQVTELPLPILNTVSAIKSIAALDDQYRDAERGALSNIVAERFETERVAAQKLRVGITIVKATLGFVTQIVASYSFFDKQIIPTVLWATTAGVLNATYQWDFRKFNADMTALTDHVLGKFESLRKYIIPVTGLESERYKPSQRMIKSVANLAVGAYPFVNLYYGIASSVFCGLVLAYVPQKLLGVINQNGILSFAELTIMTFAAGFIANDMVTAAIDTNTDVAPTRALGSVVENLGVSEARQRRIMEWGCALIGATSFLLVTSGRWMDVRPLRITVSLLAGFGVTYQIFIREMLSHAFLSERLASLRESPAKWRERFPAVAKYLESSLEYLVDFTGDREARAKTRRARAAELARQADPTPPSFDPEPFNVEGGPTKARQSTCLALLIQGPAPMRLVPAYRQAKAAGARARAAVGRFLNLGAN